jgi:hypothetical protein
MTFLSKRGYDDRFKVHLFARRFFERECIDPSKDVVG